MKFFYCIFLLLFLSVDNSFSQDSITHVFHLNKIPPEGILLDKGWKFQSGDNPDYANPDYDDKNWQTINPTLDIHDSLPQIPKQGICWFRLHLSLDSDLLNNPLSLVIQQSGASAIYVNGRLINSFGVLSTNPEEVKSYNPANKPIPFITGKSTEVVLSIRYAFQLNDKYTTIHLMENPALKISVNNLEIAVAQYERDAAKSTNSTVFSIGFFLILFIIHLAFFIFYPPQKANLYFCLFALSMLIAGIVGVNELDGINGPGSINKIFYALNIVADLPQVGNFLILTAVYSLLGEKKSWIYVGLMCITILVIILNAYYHWNLTFINIVITLMFGDIFRISLKALKNKKRGAGIIATGAIFFIIFWIAFVLGIPFNYFNTHISSTYTIADLTYNLCNLSIPIATSIYLGLDFAFTNHSLRQKLNEVENLSFKSLRQEQEKQQILASQNETLEKQVIERTAELQNSLTELKEAQSQLVQREKMASLGELTAGIAHEIQNPLNFVNNFSEVSNELIDEMKEELQNDNKEDAIAIADDIKQNLEKINHHGKRADAIVKGMLQHSQTSTGKKEPTNINKLADEYLRLSYHGLRAKDKSFTAEMKTEFDESIGNIDIIPQDIGRVLLNLYNNAFYAVDEKKKQQAENYEPTVFVSTKKVGDKISISVKDNGNGIPQKIVDKIFQPFFTTKPTGQGTGLGLSLSYDIIKVHGGEIKVESKEGEGTTFIIQLPVS